MNRVMHNSILNIRKLWFMEIISVRTDAQLNQCFKIRKKVFVEEQGVPADLEIDEFDISPEACSHTLLLIDGIPAGTGRWREYEPKTAKLQRLAVLPEYRGRGVGKRLIAVLEQQAREAGNAYCILDGQCQAEAFYHKLGYVTISQQPFEDAGIMHVRMRKLL
jgi:predicted GNAT family N-acyltransferase